MSKNHYLGVENEEQRMVWSGLSSPLQNVLNVQELQRRETQKFNYRGFRINTQQMGNKWSTVAQGGCLKCRNDRCDAKKSNKCNTSGIWVTQEVRFYSVHRESLPVSAVCVCGGDEWVKWGWLSTLRAWSLSSSWATSLPQACAILFPATRLPTIIEAGPTSVQHNHIHHHTCQWSQGQHSYWH